MNFFYVKLQILLLGEPPALYPERQRLLAKTALHGFLLCNDGSLIQSSGPVQKRKKYYLFRESAFFNQYMISFE